MSDEEDEKAFECDQDECKRAAGSWICGSKDEDGNACGTVNPAAAEVCTACNQAKD